LIRRPRIVFVDEDGSLVGRKVGRAVARPQDRQMPGVEAFRLGEGAWHHGVEHSCRKEGRSKGFVHKRPMLRSVYYERVTIGLQFC
jgi:hypothetical protein